MRVLLEVAKGKSIGFNNGDLWAGFLKLTSVKLGMWIYKIGIV
jgi:hypothetical protein